MKATLDETESQIALARQAINGRRPSKPDSGR